MNNYNTLDNFNKLIKKGDILLCPFCNQYSAYAWQDVNMDCNTGLRLTPADGLSDEGELYTDDELLSNWPDVYHIGASSGLGEWQCGNCKICFVHRDSILLAEVYTHVSPKIYYPNLK